MSDPMHAMRGLLTGSILGLIGWGVVALIWWLS